MAVKLTGITLPENDGYKKLSDFQLLDFISSIPNSAGSALSDGLAGAYVFTEKNIDRTYNYANKSLPLIQNGSPATEKKYSELSLSSGYYDTQILPSDNLVVVALISPNASQSGTGFIVSNYLRDESGSTIVSTGDSLMLSNRTLRPVAYQSGNDTTNGVSMSAPAGDIVTAGLVINSQPAMTAFSFINGASVNGGVTALTTHTLKNRSYRIGAPYGVGSLSGFSGAVRISAMLIYNRDIAASAGLLTSIQSWMTGDFADLIGL